MTSNVTSSSSENIDSESNATSISWSSDSTSTTCFSCFHLNIRSLRNKLDELTAFAFQHNVLALTETWLNSSIPNENICIKGFQEPIRHDRENGNGGGVCVYFKNDIAAK